MKILLNKLNRLLPHGDLERALTLPDRPGAGGEPGPGADLAGIDLRGRALDGADLSGATLIGPLMERAQLTGVDLTEAEIAHGRLARARLADCHLGDARLSIIDGEGMTLKGSSLAGAQLVGVSLGRACLEDVDLRGARISLSDLFGADLVRVDARGAQLRGVDLSHATFRGADLRDADLRGCTLAWCRFEDTQLTGARFDGADLRGARGLSGADRAALRAQGARLTAGWLEGRLVSLATPRMGAEAAERLARGIGLGLQVATVVGALALTLALFRDRVVPADPGADLGSDAPVALHQPTDTEIERTRASLKRLQEAIQAAHEASGRYGVAAWPSIDDLADNVYDRDGDGPGTERVTLVEGGLPPNLLTTGEAVLPYCNEVPTQETLSGDDSDWHYCDETGRIFACGGFTDVPTLDW